MKANYIVTAHKPSVVTHSCAGHFTSGDDVNLIIAKTNVIEVFKLSDQVLKPMLDFQIYGRIIALELFLPQGHKQEILFIATNLRYSFLEWNSEAGEVITRLTGEVQACDEDVVLSPLGRMDPVRSLIGLHVSRKYFEVIPFDINGQFMEAYRIRLLDDLVLDIQFLFSYPRPTIAILFKKGSGDGAYCVEVSADVIRDPEDLRSSGLHWSVPDSCENPRFLLPLPVTSPSVAPLSGVLVLGRKSIVYVDVPGDKISARGRTVRSNEIATIKSCCVVNSHELTYVVADEDGFLHKLEIVRDNMNTRVTGLKLEVLGQTSIHAAQTISYLDQQLVFVGSTYGDSQLIELNLSPDAEGSRVKALDSYVNTGPIQNLCVVDLEGRRTVVTTSGSEREAFIRVMHQGFKINKLASAVDKAITGMWSLGSSTAHDRFDKFLVVSYLKVTRVLEMNINNNLVETQIKGFSSQAQTLFCHSAVHGQLIQVTKNSVRLVSLTSGELRAEYLSDWSISTSTANLTKVLLAGEDRLVCLQIGDGEVNVMERAKTGHAVSCLYIKRIGDSELAAVGMWDDSVVIFSLPDFKRLAREPLSTKPDSVLICEFEGIPHLLCGLRDGNLRMFLLDQTSGQLTYLKEVSCGSLPVKLCTFSAKNTTLVFAASERPFVIYSNKKKLLEDKLDLKDIHYMCPFNSAAIPDSIAVAGSDELTMYKIDYQMIQIHSIPIQNVPRCFCYQECSRTFAYCTESTEQIGCIYLLKDQSFEITSSYSLEKLEVGFSIVSCSLSLYDNNVYYCVGTGNEVSPKKGRILVFRVENLKLELVAQKDVSGIVKSLTPCNGKLLACFEPELFGTKVELYMLDGDGVLQVESQSSKRFGYQPSMKARGNLIVNFGEAWMYLMNKTETGDIKLVAKNRKRHDNISVAVELLDDESLLIADHMGTIYTFEKDEEGSTYSFSTLLNKYEVRDLRVNGRFHLGYGVTVFCRGSLLQMPDSTVCQIPTSIVGTLEGAICLVASLPSNEFWLLQALQSKLREFVKGVGDFSHERFRSYYPRGVMKYVPHWEGDTLSSYRPRIEGDQEMYRTFIDGDFIELFLNLSSTRRQEVAEAMTEGKTVSVEELTKIVEKLKMLH